MNMINKAKSNSLVHKHDLEKQAKTDEEANLLHHEKPPTIVSDSNNMVDLSERKIKFDLMIMGFSQIMVDALFESEEIKDSNEGVDLLIKGQNGW